MIDKKTKTNLRKESLDKLIQKSNELKEKLTQVKNELAMNRHKDLKLAKKVKAELAVVQTIIREKQISQE